MQYHTEAVKKGRNSREAERAAAKHEKSRAALRQSDSVYQSSVAEAEESRQGRNLLDSYSHNLHAIIFYCDALQEWERETENCLSLFQDLEEGRIALLRDSLWKVTNIVSSHSVVDDSGSEQGRWNSIRFHPWF